MQRMSQKKLTNFFQKSAKIVQPVLSKNPQLQITNLPEFFEPITTNPDILLISDTNPS